MQSEHVVAAADFIKDVMTMSLTGPLSVHAVLTEDEDSVEDTIVGIVELQPSCFVALSNTVDELTQAHQLTNILLEGKVAVVSLNNQSSDLIKQLLHSLVNDNQIQFFDLQQGMVTEAVFPPGAGVLLCCTDTYLQTSGLETIISMVEKI